VGPSGHINEYQQGCCRNQRIGVLSTVSVASASLGSACETSEQRCQN
jgi:hypothetical protein